MGEPVLLRAFSSGELDPGLSVRGDLDLYARGLHTCRNFIVRRSGGVVSRPGLEHVATAKFPGPTFLYRYVFAAADESYVVEAGDFYFRFHHRTRGMGLELATPYPLDALRPSNPLGWHQAGAVVHLTHLDYPPMLLTYGGHDTFALIPATFDPTIAPPGDVVVASYPAGTRDYSYRVTAVKVNTYEESFPSAPVVVNLGAEGTPDNPVNLAWTPVADALEYRVYRDDGPSGIHGYIGSASLNVGGTIWFRDIGLAPDIAFTPPKQRENFMNAPLRYPAQVAVHGQRVIYAGTHDHRDIVHASRVGLPSNFTFRSPFQDDDAVTWRTVTQDLQTIRHLVSFGWLLVLTDRGEWVIRGDEDGAITPANIFPKQVGYVGAGWATPVVYGERVLFVEARDTVVRELQVTREQEGLSGRDLTRTAAHLFRGTRLVAMAFALVPDAILWCVRSDGVLLGLTYIPEDDVLAWHHHDTVGGLFEAITVIPEETEDAVYVIVNRGGTRTLERLGIRGDPTRTPALDRVVRFRTPGAALTGLAHLAGQRVRAVVDGRPLVGFVTRDGEFTLPKSAAVVDVGLPITADLETLDLDAPGSTVRDRRKKVTALAFLVEHSLQNFQAGPDADHLRPVKAAPWQDPADPVTGRIELAPQGTFNDTGRVFLRHTEPSTLTVLGVFPVVDVGG